MGISVTEIAATKIKEFIQQRGKGIGLRLGLNTSECSGMGYIIEFADEKNPRDYTFESHGVRLFIDPKSFFYLDGTSLDFIEEGDNAGFKFNNPNESASCECGDSFYVK